MLSCGGCCGGCSGGTRRSGGYTGGYVGGSGSKALPVGGVNHGHLTRFRFLIYMVKYVAVIGSTNPIPRKLKTALMQHVTFTANHSVLRYFTLCSYIKSRNVTR
jgi:hypothetical protein